MPLILAALLGLAWAGSTVYFGFFSDEQVHAKTEWGRWNVAIGDLDSELRSLAQKIQSSQGEGKCETTSQCRIVGLGARTCGLYKDFLVYSVLDVDAPRLMDQIREFNQLHEKRVDMSLSADDCGFKPAEPHCIDKRCLAGGP